MWGSGFRVQGFRFRVQGYGLPSHSVSCKEGVAGAEYPQVHLVPTVKGDDRDRLYCDLKPKTLNPEP